MKQLFLCRNSTCRISLQNKQKEIDTEIKTDIEKDRDRETIIVHNIYESVKPEEKAAFGKKGDKPRLK